MRVGQACGKAAHAASEGAGVNATNGDATMGGAAPVRVMALLGSLRAKAWSRGLLNAALELAPPGMAITHYAPIADLPFYNQDVEDAGDPPAVTAFKAALGQADALLVVSPEYNSGTSGVLKNAIDWASRGRSPLKGMAVAIMTSSPGPVGGIRCLLQLRQSFSGIGAVVLPAPDVAMGLAPSRFDAELGMTDESTRKLVADQLVRLRDYARMLRAKVEG
jgi:chromate reductase